MNINTLFGIETFIILGIVLAWIFRKMIEWEQDKLRNIYYKVVTSPVDRGDTFNSYESALNAFINENNAITDGVDKDLVIKDNMSTQIVINILDKPSIVINDSNILLKETENMINKLLEEKEEVGVICYYHMIHSTEVLGEEVKLMQVELYDLYDLDAFESYKDLKAIAAEGKQSCKEKDVVNNDAIKEKKERKIEIASKLFEF